MKAVISTKWSAEAIKGAGVSAFSIQILPCDSIGNGCGTMGTSCGGGGGGWSPVLECVDVVMPMSTPKEEGEL